MTRRRMFASNDFAYAVVVAILLVAVTGWAVALGLLVAGYGTAAAVAGGLWAVDLVCLLVLAGDD